jgi:putative transposase
MNEDNSIIHLRQPDEIDDPLTALLRSGARRLLEQGHCHVFIGQGAR